MSPASRPLGIVTGARAEARCLAPARVAGSVIVECSGGRVDRAGIQARALAARGCIGLLSFGLAGGLDPALPPGRLVIGTRVVGPGGALNDTHGDWTRALQGALAPLDPLAAPVAAGERIVASPADKRFLFEESGAAIVDLESGAVAMAARAAGLPFAVLRAVADPAMRALPDTAAAGLDERGVVRARAVVMGLIRRPEEIAPTIALAGYAARAMGVLRRAARLAGPALFGGGRI